MDFNECYQHYFFDNYDTEEDFYKSTAPSEDIWKKFELLPTPPMSPTRTLNGAALHPSPGDKLSWLSKVLGQDEESESHFPINNTALRFGNLSSIIIQDCMWSTFSASKQLEKVNAKGSAAAQSGVPPVAPISVRPSKAQCVSSSSAHAAPATDCVDPAAVLTFPASSCRKPASCGSESRSDSSDEDDDDDEEEEIDVVTVENKQSRAQLMNVRKPITITVRADPCPKRFHVSIHQQQHNYAAPCPDSEPEPEHEEEEEDEDEEEEEEEDEAYEEEPQRKRACTASAEEEEEDEAYEEEPQRKRACTASAQQLAHASMPSPFSETPQNSDSEDTDRRRNHNFLERKRRNDLRSRFLALRDEIPGLESSKTPKVAILTQATEYLMELHSKEKQQFQEKKRLKARQQYLLRRIAELKRS